MDCCIDNMVKKAPVCLQKNTTDAFILFSAYLI